MDNLNIMSHRSSHRETPSYRYSSDKKKLDQKLKQMEKYKVSVSNRIITMEREQNKYYQKLKYERDKAEKRYDSKQ